MIPIDQIKKLRVETSAPVMEIKKALEEASGDEKKTKKILILSGFERAAKKLGRETKAGRIFTYTHHSGTVAAVVVLLCETDFVAKNEEFTRLGQELAMQIASMNPKDEKDFLLQEYIRDGSKTIDTLIKETIAKTGENIQVGDLKRFEI